MSIDLDPRTKILFILLSVLVISLDFSLALEVLVTLIFILPFFLSGKWRWGLSFIGIYLGQALIYRYAMPHIQSAFILFALTVLTNGFRRLMPTIAAGAYAVQTTSLAEWVGAFKKWHFPRSIQVPFTVMVRFFPTIRQDYRQIRKSMALRGLGDGLSGFLKHPVQSFEHIIVPLLMNASQVAQDLTISSLSKGLGREGKQTSIVHLEFKLADWMMLILPAIPILLYIGGFI